MEDDELRATFNGGLGMIVVVAPDAVGSTIATLHADGVEAWRVGEVLAAGELGGQRYVEGAIR